MLTGCAGRYSVSAMRSPAGAIAKLCAFARRNLSRWMRPAWV